MPPRKQAANKTHVVVLQPGKLKTAAICKLQTLSNCQFTKYTSLGQQRTSLYIPRDVVDRVVARMAGLLPGANVSPTRPWPET